MSKVEEKVEQKVEQKTIFKPKIIPYSSKTTLSDEVKELTKRLGISEKDAKKLNEIKGNHPYFIYEGKLYIVNAYDKDWYYISDSDNKSSKVRNNKGITDIVRNTQETSQTLDNN